MISREHARKLRQLILQVSSNLNDMDALLGVELFPKWQIDTAYLLDDRIQYDNLLYKCVQAHTSQQSWTPDVTPALWARVFVDEFPEWIQPTGAQDAYQTGDKVSHNDKHWISITDSNVWEPGIYGWDEIV